MCETIKGNRMSRKFEIHATWDNEAAVWVAVSDDVPGLATEAETVEALMEKLRVMVPELLLLNGILPKTKNRDLPIELFAHRQEKVRFDA